MKGQSLEVRSRILWIAFWCLADRAIFAATNSAGSEEIPKLLPPREEIPLSFWDQYGVWVVVLGIFLLVVVGAAIWFLSRPRPPVPVPPEVRARQELEILRSQPENGTLLSRVSQVLKNYTSSAFGFGTGELTTTEFCGALAAHEQVGPELGQAISEFLRRCDERKFSPSGPGPALGAVALAFELINAAEVRRAQLREAAKAQAAGQTAPYAPRASGTATP